MKRFFSSLLLAAACTAALAGCGGAGLDPNVKPVEGAPGRILVVEQGRNLVEVYDDQSGALVGKVPVGNRPAGIVLGPHNSAKAYVTNSGDGTVSVIDLKTLKVAATLTVGADPEAVAGLYSANMIVVANTSANMLTFIDGSNDTVLRSVSNVGQRPTQITTKTGELGVLFAADKHLVIYDPTAAKSIASFPVTGTPSALGSAGWQFIVADSSSGAMEQFTGYVDHNLEPNAPAYTSMGSGTGPSGVAAIGANAHTTAVAIPGAIRFYNVDQKAYVDGSISLAGTVVKINEGLKEDASTSGDYDDIVVAQSPDTVTIVDQMNRKAKLSIALAGGSYPVDAVDISGTLWQLITGATPAPSAAPTATPTPAATPTPTAAPTPTATPIASGSTLYVANGNANSVEAYAAPLGAASIPAAIGFGGPASGIAYDGSSTLAIQANSNVYLYNGRLTVSSTPFATLATNVSTLIGFDASGNLYVPTHYNSVMQYKKPFSNDEQPTLLYVSDHSSDVAFDGSGTMYVSNSSGNLDVVAAPYANNSQITLVPAAGGSLSAVAVRGSVLYAADTANNAIYAYNLPLTAASTPFYTYTAADPEAIAFDASGYLYVSDDNSNRVDVYNPPSSQAPLQSAYSLSGNGLSGPFGLAFGP